MSEMRRAAESLEDAITRVVAEVNFGTASARKTGRNPKWPYVPVIKCPSGVGDETYDHQIRGLAYATRDEALDAARRHLEAERRALAKRLADPRHRAEREQYGLPREIT